MVTFIPVLLNSLAGALASKVLLFCVRRNGSFVGLFFSWLFASLIGLYTPHPFFGALIFGLFF